MSKPANRPYRVSPQKRISILRQIEREREWREQQEKAKPARAVWRPILGSL